MTKKVPTRSPTDEPVPYARLSSMGLELDEIAEDGEVSLAALVELAEDRGRPASHYIAALPLATELTLKKSGGTEVRICAGNCQSYGALVLIDHLVPRALKGGVTITPVECLDRCDVPAVCELRGAQGQLVLAPAMRLLHTLVHVVVQLVFDKERGRHVPAIYYDPMYALSVVR